MLRISNSRDIKIIHRGLGDLEVKSDNARFIRVRSGCVRPALSNAAKSSSVTSPKVFPFSGLSQYWR
jgi:hypothetical protein